MPPHHAARVLRHRSAEHWTAATEANFNWIPVDSVCIRLLVLDKDPRTPEQIENALWVWPHKISTAKSVEEAVKMCQHLEPAAIIASLDFSDNHGIDIVSALRNKLPNVAIIAVGSAEDVSKPHAILELGADAIVARQELQRPTLHSLLMRLRPVPEIHDTPEAPPPNLPLPWRESEIVGSLLCDIKGTITSVNECLARWLGYSAPGALLGKCVWRDLLNSHTDWTPWKTVAGDMTALLHQSIAVKARNEQLLWMKVQIFAAPNSPSDLQAVFVDQTELAHLTDRHLGGEVSSA